MSDMLEGFGESPGLENDEDIGALGSILSWDDDDEDRVQASVAATSSALDAQQQQQGAASAIFGSNNNATNTSINSRMSSVNSSPAFTSMLPSFMNLKDATDFLQQLSVLGQPSPILAALAASNNGGGMPPALSLPSPALRPQQAAADLPEAVQSSPQLQPQQTIQQAQAQQQAQMQRIQAQQAQVQQAAQQAQQAQNFQLSPPAALTAANLKTQQQQQQQLFRQQPAAAGLLMPGFPNLFGAGGGMAQQGPSLAISQEQQAALLRQFQQQVAMQQQQLNAAAAAAAAASRPMVPPPNNMMKAPPRKRKSASGSTTATDTRTNIVSCSDTDGESKPPPTKTHRKSSSTVSLSTPLDTTGMSTEEKAKVNRDRNREHARNTRLRKKAYLEKLKTTVDELCRERDSLVSERAGAANLLVEVHNTRTEVLMSFFALRSAFEKRRELWASILDESCFSCVMPVTPYRSFPASEVQVSKCQRTVMGIDAMMADTASLHVLLNSLIDRLRYPTAKIEFRYTLVTEDAVVAGNQLMARWIMTTTNATRCGARSEVSKQGMLCCKFNSAHKIIALELMFDVMAFMLQLKQAAGTDAFAVVPNTVQTCQRSFDVPMVMTLAERPYTIVQVNKLWEDMTGYAAEDIVGKASCRILQGQETDTSALDELMLDVRYKRPASAMLVNYTRTGKRFRNYFSVFPLSTDSKITHYVALSSHVDMIDSIAAAESSASNTTAATLPHPQLTHEMLPPASPFLADAVNFASASVTASSSNGSQEKKESMPPPPSTPSSSSTFSAS